MQKLIKRLPWHTLFFMLYCVLFLFAENVSMVKFADIFRPLTYVLGGTIVLYIISYIVFRDMKKSAVFSSAVVLLFFSYGHYYELFYPQRIPIINVRLDQNFYKWSGLIILLLIIWRYRIKGISAKNAHQMLNFISALLLLMPVYKIIQFKSNQYKIKIEEEFIPANRDSELTEKPDIYYLIADAYGRDDVLKEIYGFDNREFLKFLESRGFYVADKSFANYGQTVLSIPSTLNMMYLDSFAREVGLESDNRWPLKYLLNENKTLKILKTYGYKSVAFDASMFPAVYLDSADFFIETPGAYVNLFENELINSTIIRAFHRDRIVSDEDSYGYHRKKILTAFEQIKKLSKQDGQFYVHGHVLVPHQPFVFDSLGNAVQPRHSYTIWRPIEDGRDPERYKKEYISQLKFVNRKLMETIDFILKHSKVKPIIIIQGDHGPSAELLNTEGFEDNNFRERMPILNAYYFPDKDYSRLYKNISPVNSYRIIFNQFFDADYPLLKDSSYYSTWKQPYFFYNVTDSLN